MDVQVMQIDRTQVALRERPDDPGLIPDHEMADEAAGMQIAWWVWGRSNSPNPRSSPRSPWVRGPNRGRDRHRDHPNRAESWAQGSSGRVVPPG